MDGRKETMKVKALAKVNLGLDVLRRREDGYHEIRMIMQTIHLYDQLQITKTREQGITIETNLDFLPVNENNLVYKAAKLMQDFYELDGGVHVVLNKHIPVAAGLAGGSTDAAAVMYGMTVPYPGKKAETYGAWGKNRGGCALLPDAGDCPGGGNRGEIKKPSPCPKMSGAYRKTRNQRVHKICI